MQINLVKLPTKKFLYFSLLAIGLTIVTANFFGQEIAGTITNLLYVPIPGVLLVLSAIIAARFRGKGVHGKAWILFFGLACSWFIAEQLWVLYDLVFHVDPFPSEADFFYLLGYPFLFLFSIYYLRPVEKAITKKILIYAFSFSIVLLVPTVYITSTSNSEASWSEIILAASYPAADVVVMFPAVVGLVLFFKGEVNFFWALTSLAIMMNVVADTGFLFTSLNDSYYTGSPIDILYLWSYVMFSFGVYSHIKIFKTRSYEKKYFDLEGLR